MAQIIIVGGGMSGMSLAWRITQLRPDYSVSVLESSDRAGGKAWTEKISGFLCERGVNGVLDNKPATLNLAAELNLAPLKSNEASKKRFIIRDGKLCPLPESPAAFLKSGILSFAGKMRLALEPFIARGVEGDESLADFAIRRLGREAFSYLIDPMSSGIYAGDPYRLSLKSCFPRIHELERDYGSLIRAMFKLKHEARKKGATGPGAGPGGALTSFINGMGELASRLASALGDRIKRNKRVVSAEKTEEGWQVSTDSGEVFKGSHLVMACPAFSAARILKDSMPDVSDLIGEIPYPPVSLICMAVKKEQVPLDLDGFGFLAPSLEKRPVLGALWDSSIFAGRAPDGWHLIRILAGGARHPEIAQLDDSKLTDIAVNELTDLTGLKGMPEILGIFRWDKAIPQYNVGHEAMMYELSRLLDGRRLYMRCNWIGGVSLNDCIAASNSLAEYICQVRRKY